MDLIKKSVNVIKSLQLKNGGILAGPLGEAYPYVYVRDGVIMTKAMNRTGNVKVSERFYDFINKFSKINHYKDIFHRYDKEGHPSATRKKQQDNIGLLLHGIYDTFLTNRNEKFLNENWNLIKSCCELIFNLSKNGCGLIYTETSLHEFFRLENGYEIWANCACCRGLYDAVEIAKILKKWKEAKKWKKKAKLLHKNIKAKLFNKKTGLYMKSEKYPQITDIAQIAPFYFNLEDSEKILKNTVIYIKKNLWYRESGGFRRFKKFEVVKDWHWYTGGSGGWIAFTAWMARFYRQLNDKKNYNLCEKWLEKTASRTNGYFPEHIATKKEYNLWKKNEIEFNNRILIGMDKAGELNKKLKKKFKEDIVYWAMPLGWAHAEYILLKKEEK